MMSIVGMPDVVEREMVVHHLSSVLSLERFGLEQLGDAPHLIDDFGASLRLLGSMLDLKVAPADHVEHDPADVTRSACARCRPGLYRCAQIRAIRGSTRPLDCCRCRRRALRRRTGRGQLPPGYRACRGGGRVPFPGQRPRRRHWRRGTASLGGPDLLLRRGVAACRNGHRSRRVRVALGAMIRSGSPA